MRRKFMKKLCFTLAVILCLGALPACGGNSPNGENSQSGANHNTESGSGTGQNGENPGSTAGSGVYDIFSDKEQVIGWWKKT